MPSNGIRADQPMGPYSCDELQPLNLALSWRAMVIKSNERAIASPEPQTAHILRIEKLP